MTNNSAVVRRLYVFVSEFRPLQFQSGIDYPERSGHEHIHYT